MTWLAQYNDGSSLPQFNPDGSENNYADIDRQRLAAFSIVKDNAPAIVVHLDPGQRLIYRRRVAKHGNGQETVVLLVGWQATVNGRNVQSIAYVYPDASIHMAGEWRDDHPWFYPIQTVPCEEM